MPKKKNRENYREHQNMDLECLRQFVADERPITSIAYLTALRLRYAIGASRHCDEAACKRRNICARPVLECAHLDKASKFDWDYGWYHSQRKDIYGVDKYAWMRGVTGGPPEFLDAQRQKHRDDYDLCDEEQKAKTARRS